MRARKATVELQYNGAAVKTSLKEFGEAFSYTDPAGGSSDSISLTVGDPRYQWISAWLPHKGDQITAKILFEERDGDEKTPSLDCGLFTLDDLSYSDNGGKAAFKMSGVSAPALDAFSATERTQNWEKVTLKKVAQTIASRYKLQLVFDATDVAISTQEQSSATDSSFLNQLCNDYGLMLKVFRSKIVIFDREKYKKKDPVATIPREEMSSFSWNTTLAGSYTGGTITYTDPKTKKDVTYTTGGGKRLLKSSTKADNLADAKRKIEAAVTSANHSITTISFQTMGRPDLCAGQTIMVTGVGRLSGKFYIDKKTDSLTSTSYTSKIEASQVPATSDAVIVDAIQRLAAIGVINSPGYWIGKHKSVKYLDDLLLQMATTILVNHDTGLYTGNPQEALDALVKYGVINTRDYWAANMGKLQYISDLICKAANALPEIIQ